MNKIVIWIILLALVFGLGLLAYYLTKERDSSVDKEVVKEQVIDQEKLDEKNRAAAFIPFVIPEDKELPVSESEDIAFSSNTGGSFVKNNLHKAEPAQGRGGGVGSRFEKTN
jgi:hypothetical protein